MRLREVIALGAVALAACAFSSSAGAADDASGLLAVSRDGSSQRVAADSDDVDFDGTSWSRDGLRVAFLRGSRLVAREIAGSQTETTIATAPKGKTLEESAWSPAAERIAFVVTEDKSEVGELRTSSPTGGDVRTLVKAASPAHLRWSPDGRRLLFEGDYETRCRVRGRSFNASTTAIFVISSTGGAKKRVTTPDPCNRSREISDTSPEWITRTRFAFIRDADDEPNDVPLGSRLYAGDVRNAKLRRLKVPVKNWEGIDAEIDVSADGKLVALEFAPFELAPGANFVDDAQLWVVPVDGTAARRMKLRTEKGVDGDVSGPVFAPNGQIAICEDASRGVTLIDSATGKRTRLASFSSCIPYAWSPSGDRLLVSVEDLAR